MLISYIDGFIFPYSASYYKQRIMYLCPSTLNRDVRGKGKEEKENGINCI